MSHRGLATDDRRKKAANQSAQCKLIINKLDTFLWILQLLAVDLYKPPSSSVTDGENRKTLSAKVLLG